MHVAATALVSLQSGVRFKRKVENGHMSSSNKRLINNNNHDINTVGDIAFKSSNKRS